MALPTTIQGDVIVNGALSASNISLPAGSVKGSAVSNAASDRIGAAVVVHQFPRAVDQALGSDVSNSTRIVHIAKGAGTLVGVQAVAAVAPTGGDKATSINVLKSSNGSNAATMLASNLTLNSNTAASLIPLTATLGVSPTYAAGDVIEIGVTVSGSTGNQAQGLCVTAFFQENPA